MTVDSVDDFEFRSKCDVSAYWTGGHDVEFGISPNRNGFYRCLFCDKAVYEIIDYPERPGQVTILLHAFTITEMP